MAKLILKFGNAMLKEVHVGQSGVRIGRSPNNGLVIDNQAVSHHHARVFTGVNGRLILEDLGSTNGTFLNGQLVKNAALNPGDFIAIGKHRIVVEDSRDMEGFSAWKPAPGPAVPKVYETKMLVTKERLELLQRIAADGDKVQIAPQRLKVPMLLVHKGKTDQGKYMLADKLTVIGKSAMATVKLRGWFAPNVAVQINRREDDAYYLGTAGRIPRVNGKIAARPTKLQAGDIIEVAGIRLEFGYSDEGLGSGQRNASL